MERRILRRIYGPMVQQGIWRIRNNKELRELYEDLDIVADIKNIRIGRDWTCSKNGSVRRVKGAFKSKPEGRRRQRRPGLKWLEVQRRIDRRRSLRDGARRQSIGKNGRP